MPTLAVKKQQMALLKTPEQLPSPRILEANLHMYREVVVAAQGSSEAVSSDVEVAEPDIQSTSTKKKAVNERYARDNILQGRWNLFISVCVGGGGQRSVISWENS